MNATPAKKSASARAATRQATATARKVAAKRVTRTTPKVAAKPLAKAPVKAEPKVTKPAIEKPRKPKLVRDSFTIPKTEYAAIDALKQRAAQAGHSAKKSELLRAGLIALGSMTAPAFLAALQAVPAIKTGRPSKG
jgi:hypothetical protein